MLSLYYPCTIPAPSPHHPCTITARSLCHPLYQGGQGRVVADIVMRTAVTPAYGSLHHHCAIIEPSLRCHCAITAPSPHHHCTIRGPLRIKQWCLVADIVISEFTPACTTHHHCTITAPCISLHHHHTITAPSPHHHCTSTAPSPHHQRAIASTITVA